MHESNGIDIIIALVLSEISMDLVLELKVRQNGTLSKYFKSY